MTAKTLGPTRLDLWVSADTYLPVQSVTTAPTGAARNTGTTVSQYSFLSPSQSNLANLTRDGTPRIHTNVLLREELIFRRRIGRLLSEPLQRPVQDRGRCHLAPGDRHRRAQGLTPGRTSDVGAGLGPACRGRQFGSRQSRPDRPGRSDRLHSGLVGGLAPLGGGQNPLDHPHHRLPCRGRCVVVIPSPRQFLGAPGCKRWM
jgi:hypothetical protein